MGHPTHRGGVCFTVREGREYPMFSKIKKWARLFALTVVLNFLSACQSNMANLPTPDANFSEATSSYPGVVEVILPLGQGMCSGSFVSPNTVITASHCVPSAGTYTVTTSWGSFSTSTYFKYGPGTVDDPNDIAFLVFSQNVASATQGQIIAFGTSVNSGDTVRLVGYGCDDLSTEAGTGVKRTGTNVIYTIDNFLELVTPPTVTSKVLGPDNRAGSCFGDSGGPALETDSNNNLVMVGVTHAGGTDSSGNIDSEYIDLLRNDNQGWLSQTNQAQNLGIPGL
jgi:hypothetical protein